MQVVFIITNSMEKLFITGNQSCLLGTLQNFRIHREHVALVAPQQLCKGLKCKTKTMLSIIMKQNNDNISYVLLLAIYGCYFSLNTTPQGVSFKPVK